MKKIIYIFSRRHYYVSDDKSYGIDYFMSQGYEVEVWSIVDWTFGEGLERPRESNTSNRGVYIKNLKEFQSEMDRIEKEEIFFIIYPYHAYDTIQAEIRKTIIKANKKFCNLSEQSLIISTESVNTNISVTEILRHELHNIPTVIKSYVRYLQDCLKKEENKNEAWKTIIYPLIYKSSFNFIMGEYLYRSFPNWLEILSKRNVIIPSFDYSDIIDCENQAEKRQPYIVYIDQYHVGHSDYKKLGYDYPIKDANIFYEEMNEFFAFLEEKYAAEVIIAAHPKAEYKGFEFNSRNIVYYQTIPLIKDAEIVISGPSTCIETVAYYRKKLICLGNEQMLQHNLLGSRLHNMELEFETKVCNISDRTYKNSIDEFISCNLNRYRDIVNIGLISDNCKDKDKYYKVIEKKVRKLYDSN